MKQLLKLVIPERLEALLYICIAFVLLAVQSIKPIKLYLDNATDTVGVTTNGYQSQVSVWVNNIVNRIDPRLVDFVVWLLIGCLVFVAVSIVIAGVKSTDEEAHLLQYYKSPTGKHHELNAFATKMAIRLIGGVGLLFWLVLFLGSINSMLINLFFTALVSIKHPQAWLWLPLSVVMFAVCIYVFTIMIRLMFLKIRVFGNYEEE